MNPSKRVAQLSRCRKFGAFATWFWSKFIDELRHLHLAASQPRVSIFAWLHSAYDPALAKKQMSRGR
jgi:hypothetical protein